MPYSANFEIKIEGPVLDKLDEMSEQAYTKNAYVDSPFHDLKYYEGYQQALKEVKEFLLAASMEDAYFRRMADGQL